MRISGLCFILMITGLSSCKLTEANVAGIYQLERNPATTLILHKDNTFEYINCPQVRRSGDIRDTSVLNFFSAGTWKFENKTVLLDSRAPDLSLEHAGIADSITRFTSISSFNFWNRYGQPVNIRSILLPPSRPKPHFGNSLYFFGQDFTRADTLKFFFSGYPVFTYPGSIPAAIGNNIHKITLFEPYRQDAFTGSRFHAKGNRLLGETQSIFFKKKNKAGR